MLHLHSPNLPEAEVCLVAVDARIAKQAIDQLNSSGIATIPVHPHERLQAAVSGHPDMMLHHLGGNMLVYAPGTDPSVLDALLSHGFDLISGERELAPTYPADIAYNAARIGKHYFHNLKHTDPILKKQLSALDIEPVHVEQGYTKCSILPVGPDAIVTMDTGIAKAAERKGYDVLLLERERSIRLPGLNYGFIGGAAGMLGKSLCAVNGRVRELHCFEAFTSFLSDRNVAVVELAGGPVTDVGSILPLMTR